jgi:hypothetical protein
MVNRAVYRKRSFLTCFLGLFFFCAPLFAQRPQFPFPAQTPGTPPGQKPAVLKMRVNEGLVTAEITDCPMQNVLKEMAERTGVIFEVRSQDNPLISIRLSGIPIQESIQRMASGSNTVFLYDDTDPGRTRIQMVRIYPRDELPQPGIVYLGTGTITKTDETVENPEQALKVLAEGKSIEGREKAIELLVSTKNKDAVPALTGAIADPAPEIRAAAIEGLAALGARAALPGIIKSLNDEHPGVRQSATNAVALLGDAGNLKDLKPLIRDKDASVAAAAETAIRKLSAAAKK